MFDIFDLFSADGCSGPLYSKMAWSEDNFAAFGELQTKRL